MCVTLGGSRGDWTECVEKLPRGAGRFLREESGEPVARLLALSTGGESLVPTLDLLLEVVEGVARDHDVAILELGRIADQNEMVEELWSAKVLFLFFARVLFLAWKGKNILART